MEFEGSKTPWHIGSHPCNDQSRYTVRSDSNTVIAHVSQPSDNEQRARADADLRLIAAAPELLEALRELIQTYEYSLRIGYERIIELGDDCDSPEIMITKDSSLNKAKAAIAKALGQQ
ncbi:hypothetical protein WMR86_08080 [Proteus vulgaris]